MLIESQKKFLEDYIKPENVKLPAGYDAMFAQWLDFNSEIAARLSAEEKTKSFVDFLDEKIGKKIAALLNDDKLKRLNARGQIVLAAADGGKTFDKLIAPEDLGAIRGEQLYFLSTTLRSTTTNIKELMDEQVLLHVVANLKKQNDLIESAAVENGVINVKVKNPKGAQNTVAVDPDQSADKPLDYTFTNEKGVSTTVPETRLSAEPAGSLQEDASLQPLNEGVSDDHRGLALAGGVLSSLPDMAGDLQNTRFANLAAAAATLPKPRKPIVMPRFERPAPIPVPEIPAFDQVQDSKRKFEEQKQNEEIAERSKKQKQTRADEEARKKLRAQNQVTPRAPKKPISQSPVKRAVMAGLGLGGMVLGGLGGSVAVTMYINTILKP